MRLYSTSTLSVMRPYLGINFRGCEIERLYMKHFELTQWADYVRGVLSPSANELLGAHLSECQECGDVANMLRRVSITATSDRQFEPPRYVVEAAENIFPSREIPVGLRPVMGHLSFDSFAGAMPVGVRSLRPESRHLVYDAGVYSIDLLVDGDHAEKTLTLTGHVVNKNEPGANLGPVRAIALSSQRVVASAMANDLGEFSLTSAYRRNLRLLVPLEAAGECLELSLKSPKVSS